MRVLRFIAATLLMTWPLKQSILAQSKAGEQLWFEYFLNYSFANVYNLENSLTYSTNLNTPKWREFDIGLTLERTFAQYVDGMVGFTFISVLQNDTSNSIELRPMIGARIHFTPNRRVLTRLLLRLEQRNFQDRESSEWDRSVRSRVRAETIIPINRKSFHEDRQWYGMLDAEWFFVHDQDVNERFANRFRFRTGLGYRWNASWRFEILYLQQQSKNKIGEDFYTSDNIIRFRVKYYITRTGKRT